MIFGKKPRVEKILQNAPGPSPWYLYKNGPEIPGLKWVSAEDSRDKSGKFLLKQGDDVVLIVSMYNYIKVFDENHLLIWYQSYSQNAPSYPVNLKILDITKMQRLEGDIEELCEDMSEKKISSVFNTPVIHELELSTYIAEKEVKINLPPLLKKVDELLILCHSSGVVGENRYSDNIGLMVVHPPKNCLKIYPQDWFNNGEFDFGYQWITRVGRDKKTGKIYGDGIRISPFVLDDSLKDIKRVCC